MSVIFLILLSIFTMFSIIVVHGNLAKIFLLVVIGIWLVLYGVSLVNPFGLYEVSVDVYLIDTLGILSFIFGYLSLNLKNKNYKFDILKGINVLISNKVIRIIFLCCFVVLFSLAITQWTIVDSQGGLGSLKVDFFDLVFNNNSTLYFFYQVILCPLFYMLCMISLYMVASNEFNLKSILLLIYIVCFAYIGGKRGYFAIILQYFIIVYIVKRYATCTQKLLNESLPIKKLLVAGVMIFWGAAYMTAVSSTGTSSTSDDFKTAAMNNVENMIIYQVGPYRALDYALDNDFFNRYGAYTLGRSTFGGIVDYYGCSILRYIGINIPQARALSMTPLQDNSISVGKDWDWNFSYTSYYYFMFDFGLVGVICFSYLFGLFVRYSLNRFENNGTIGDLCLVGYLFISCLLFHGTWFNVSLYAIPTIVICLFLSRFELNSRKNNDKKYSITQ